jgi:hypothetical protein
MLKLNHKLLAGAALGAAGLAFLATDATAGSDRSPTSGANVEFREFDLNAFFGSQGAPYVIDFAKDEGFFYSFSGEGALETILANQDTLPLVPPPGKTADFLPPTFYNGTVVLGLAQESETNFLSQTDLDAVGRTDLSAAEDVVNSEGEVIGEAKVIAKVIKVEKLNPAAPDPSLFAIAPYSRLTLARETSFRWNNKAVVHYLTNRNTGEEYILFVAPFFAAAALPIATVGGLAPILLNPFSSATPFFQANWQYKSCVLKQKLVAEADGRLEVMVGPPSGWQNLNGAEVKCRTGEGEYFESP